MYVQRIWEPWHLAPAGCLNEKAHRSANLHPFPPPADTASPTRTPVAAPPGPFHDKTRPRGQPGARLPATTCAPPSGRRLNERDTGAEQSRRGPEATATHTRPSAPATPTPAAGRTAPQPPRRAPLATGHCSATLRARRADINQVGE
ncbi:sterile alpha motif domain-containing protein 1-like [Schistocerca americana]|uniref:sterile alpha motif domain-containing protein 1-like n=1 Tax=Schistocerca americana TaxID=7009 RepID=UPI001F4F5A50|nr:sterile alpha motif domain-containing protein 1-like [Schistocerca americana]